jgi:hypothetical protein
MTNDIKSGLLPMTTLVRIDLAMDTGQLTAKQSKKSTSQMLKFAMFDEIVIGCKNTFFSLSFFETNNKTILNPFSFHRSERNLNFFVEPKRKICNFVKNLDL